MRSPQLADSGFLASCPRSRASRHMPRVDMCSCALGTPPIQPLFEPCCVGLEPDPMPSWQSSLVSQSQPEGGSHLPLGNFGWIPSSRDFGFLGGSSRVRDSGLSIGSAQCAVCVCPMGYSLILSSTHILPASEHRNCARLCALRDTLCALSLFSGRRGDNFSSDFGD